MFFLSSIAWRFILNVFGKVELIYYQISVCFFKFVFVLVNFKCSVNSHEYVNCYILDNRLTNLIFYRFHRSVE